MEVSELHVHLILKFLKSAKQQWKSLSGIAVSEPLAKPSEFCSLYLRPRKVKTRHRFALTLNNLDLPCCSVSRTSSTAIPCGLFFKDESARQTHYWLSKFNQTNDGRPTRSLISVFTMPTMIGLLPVTAKDMRNSSCV